MIGGGEKRGREDTKKGRSEETRGDECRRPAREIREDVREGVRKGGWGEEAIGEERGRKGNVEERVGGEGAEETRRRRQKSSSGRGAQGRKKRGGGGEEPEEMRRRRQKSS